MAVKWVKIGKNLEYKKGPFFFFCVIEHIRRIYIALGMNVKILKNVIQLGKVEFPIK